MKNLQNLGILDLTLSDTFKSFLRSQKMGRQKVLYHLALYNSNNMN